MEEKAKSPQLESIEPADANSELIEREIELERLRKETAEAEKDAIEAAEKARRATERSNRVNELKGLSFKKLLVPLVILALVVAAIPTLILPMLTPAPQNKYFSESDLEKVVNISKLSTVDYVYNGIAEKVPDNVSVLDFKLFEYGGYRIKYEAHVPVSFDMSQIKFEIDDDAKVVTAFLPNPTVETPRLDGEKLDYLPSSVSGNLQEDLELCKADALEEVPQEKEIKERAFDNLKSTVAALTIPLINGYELEYQYLEDQGTEGDDNED